MARIIEVTQEIIDTVKNTETTVREMALLIGMSPSRAAKLIKEIKGKDYVFQKQLKPKKPKKEPMTKKLSEQKNRTKSKTETIFEEEKRLIKEGKNMIGVNQITEAEKVKNGTHKWEVGPNRSMVLKKIEK